MMFWQRLKVCLRLLRALARLVLNGQISLMDCFNIEKRGNGLSSTFIVGKRAVIKIKNEKASAGNRKLYNGKFDGLFFYGDDAERLSSEFQFYDLLYRHGMTAKPVLLTKNALVTSYINAESLQELPSELISRLFDLMDRVHALDVFHGDFNLSNFLQREGDLFVVDFESSRRVSSGQSDDLYALDTVIFIEKLNRFHKRAFANAAPLIKFEIEKRKSQYVRVRDVGKKYLPGDVYAAIF